MRNLVLILISIITTSNFGQQKDFASYVNPLIGTDAHGHTFPGASLPFGMVQLSPDTRIDGSWDGCSGYHYSDNVIYGFSHTHLSGTGVSDYGDLLLMPSMGKPELDAKNYNSSFSHKEEKAEAGFYKVKLDKHDIDVSLTVSTRVGFHQYQFNEGGQANIILDLNHRDRLLEGEVILLDSKSLLVKRRSEAWATNQFVFALIKFSVPMKLNAINCNGNPGDLRLKKFNGTQLALSLGREVKKGEKIEVKVALSMTGYDGATLNSSELKHWDFEKAKSDAKKVWEEELSKIEVTTDDNNKLSVFYTALYHTFLQPNIANDLDGKYRGRDHMIHTAEGFDYYTVFSLWDTFRATHPLYTLIDQKRTSDFINTFIKQYEQANRLPVWELASNETDCMIGYHSVSVIADAMAKGIKGFDYEKAFQAAKHSAMLNHFGLDAYKNFGVINVEDEHESVSKTLEYAYDDWCIAQMAKQLKHDEDAIYFTKRSQYWKNIFDWKTGFMRAKKNGNWIEPFDPREVNNYYTEGNSWQYSFFVPQDISGLIEMHGGKQNFEKKIDELFNSEPKTTGREQVDITGLIGQYAHGNEPSHHIAYLYNFVDKPDKTKEKVHYILNEFYKNSPDGLIGNEDCGQMSAWYVLSSMGIYSITPGKVGWETSTPLFESVRIKMEDGSYRQINKGETIPKNLGFEKVIIDKNTLDTKGDFIISPLIKAQSRTFTEQLKIELEGHSPNDKIYFWFDGQTENNIQMYDKPIEIKESKTLHSYIIDANNHKSHISKATFYKKPNIYAVELISKYNPQYHAGGPEGLIDGIKGDENWKKGDWQGYQSQDFEVIIDLKQKTNISSISSTYLQDTRSWILMPTYVEYYISNDKIHYEIIDRIKNSLKPEITDVKIRSFESHFDLTSCRYVKVIAKNYGKLPEWHQGFPFGGEAFIFVDEVVVK